MTIFTVNSLLDVSPPEPVPDGLITLREALEAANTNAAVGDAPAGSATETDTIRFAPGLFLDGQDPLPGKITLSGTQLTIADNLSLEGPGAELLSIDANQKSRVFYVNSGVTASLDGLTITGGKLVGSGGGVYNLGALTVRNSTISGNSAVSTSSNSACGGGIYSSGGSVSITDSTFVGNSAAGNSPAYGGGIFFTGITATLIITNSSLVENSAVSGGAVYSDGYTLIITESTLLRNTAASMGGGIFNATLSRNLTVTSSILSGNSAVGLTYGYGGGIYNCGSNAKVTITNSALSGNSALYGGAIYGDYAHDARFAITNSTLTRNRATHYGGGIYNADSKVMLTNSTIAFNSAGSASKAGSGGGIFGLFEDRGTVTVRNCIVAMNEAGIGSDYNGPFASGSDHNLIGIWNSSRSRGTDPGDHSTWGTVAAPLDPVLTTMLDETGAAAYCRPNPGSPAIDAGSDALAVAPDGSPLATDMLGHPRICSISVDIGAVEHTDVPEVVVASSGYVDLIEGVPMAIRVSLTAPPTAPVMVTIEKCPGGSDDLTVDPATLVFDRTNWDLPQTATLSAAEDEDRDNDDSAMFAFSGNAISAVRLFVSVADNDAQHYVVDSLEDLVAADGVLTLREAIEAANTNTAVADAPEGCEGLADVITFAPVLFLDGGELVARRIVLGGTQLTIADDLDIQGPGGSLLLVDANKLSRVLSINSGVTAAIDGLTITGGKASFGGGVYNLGSLAITNSTLSGNLAAGAPYVGGGAIYSYGSVSITNSTVSGNLAKGPGGGIYSHSSVSVANSTLSGNTADRNYESSYGGAVYSDCGGVAITSSTLADNSAIGTPCAYGGGVYSAYGSVNVTNSILSGNSAAGASYGYGGGVHGAGTSATVIITNCVLSRNWATGPLAGYGGAIFNSGNTVSVTNSTIAGGWAAGSGAGGGICLTSGTLRVANSIIAANGAPSNPDIYGSLSPDSEYNLIGLDARFVITPGPGADGVWGTGDDVLGDLHLRAGSAAIQAGRTALAIDRDGNPLVTDLDGRPRVVGPSVDIGAYEFQYPLAPEDRLPGDANLDAVVDNRDAAILAAHWQMAEGVAWGDGDFNGDGRVDDLDVSILAANWQAESVPGEAASGPAPSAGVEGSGTGDKGQAAGSEGQGTGNQGQGTGGQGQAAGSGGQRAGAERDPRFVGPRQRGSGGGLPRRLAPLQQAPPSTAASAQRRGAAAVAERAAGCESQEAAASVPAGVAACGLAPGAVEAPRADRGGSTCGPLVRLDERVRLDRLDSLAWVLGVEQARARRPAAGHARLWAVDQILAFELPM